MATKKQPKIICFTMGSVPSVEALELADKYGSGVVFRNAHFVGSGDKPEDCDGVCGVVPEIYKKHPTAEEAVAVHKEQVEAERKAEKEKREARKKATATHKAEVAKATEEAEKAAAAKEKAQADAAKKAKAAAAAKSAAAKAETKSAANTWTANK